MQDKVLAQLLLQGEPDTIALIGEPVSRLASLLGVASGIKKTPQIVVSSTIQGFIDTTQPSHRAPAQTVLCLSLSGKPENAESLLGLACRTAPKLVLVEHQPLANESENLSDASFYAFGFRSMGAADKPGDSMRSQAGFAWVGHTPLVDKPGAAAMAQRRWFAYSLSDYKQSPEWLNARFWAHPERFDLPD